MLSKFSVIPFCVFILFCSSAYTATFKGRVIDADMKEPIEGAVVLAHWDEGKATIAGESTRFKDVKETLTDKNGEWVIEGPRGRRGGNIMAIFTFLTGIYYTQTPEFIIFKPGYCSWPKGFGIDACRGKIKIEGDAKSAEGEVAELSKLTDREDRLRAMPGIIAGRNSLEKQKEFIRLINEEGRNLGLSGEVYK